jgi:cytidylate kinase
VSALLVITGPPGAGKSTVARVVAHRFEPSVLVEGDAFFAFFCARRHRTMVGDPPEDIDAVAELVLRKFEAGSLLVER